MLTTPTKTSKHFYIILILSLVMIKFALSAPNIRQTQSEDVPEIFLNILSCVEEETTISNKKCLNNNIRFEQKKYQMNNFAKKENEDFLLQISEQKKYDSARLFYGLTNEGRYFFSNESSYSDEFNVDIDEETFIDNEFYFLNPIKDSKNLFVSIKNSTNKENKYLFSINSYNSMVELYDLNNGNNDYIIWSFHKFFNIDPDDYFFPFDYELFEIKDRAEYIIVFIPQMNIDELILDVNFMIKFRFQTFDTNAYEYRGALTYEDFLDTKILNIVLMKDKNRLVVLSLNETVIEYQPPPVYAYRRRVDTTREKRLTEYYQKSYKFNLKFYNSNLKRLFYIKDVELNNALSNHYQGGDLFIKSLYLNFFGYPFVFLIYLDNYYNSFICDLFYMNFEQFKNNENTLNPIRPPYLQINNEGFDIEESPNEFIKVKDTQVVFIYVIRMYSNELIIKLIDLDIYNGQFNQRSFYINLENYFPTQIKGFAYNNHLMFSSTGGIVNNNNGYYNNINFAEYLSMFMIFGYANGTDSTIDISKFLFKKNNEGDNNFFDFLYKNLTIENDIFGYVPIGIIKLVHIPEEISISLSYLGNEVDNPLEGPFIGSNCFPYYEENCVEIDYRIKQNKSIIKTSEYYYIDYQYILVDIELYSEGEIGGGEIGGGGSDEVVGEPQERRRLQDELNRNINFEHPLTPFYYGRINRLQFKLCHEYCETCYELDESKDNHRCSSCLPQYQYDYLYFTNQKEKNPETCVPEGYYYDIAKKDISLCNSIEHKYYINTTDNKRICFPNEDKNKCPSSYPLYNETRKECYYCDFERFKNGECTANDLTI